MKEITTTARHLLALDWVFDAPVAKFWQYWTESELFVQWFLTEPWRVSDAKLDLRNGGELSCATVGPNGEQHEHTRVFLDVLREKRIMHTNVFHQDWISSGQMLMFVHISPVEIGDNKKHYVADAMYWNAKAGAEHERKRLFTNRDGPADRMETLARSLADNNSKYSLIMFKGGS